MPVSPPASPVPRVLLAEDSRSCQEFVRIVMKQAGLKLDVVSNGVEAIEALSMTDYALVLMDCLMPVSSCVKRRCSWLTGASKQPSICSNL